MFKKRTAQQFPKFDFQQYQRPSDVTVVQIIHPNLIFKHLNTFSLGPLEVRQASSWPWPVCFSLKSRNLLLFLRGISSSFSYNLRILIPRSTGAYSIHRTARFLSSLFEPLSGSGANEILQCPLVSVFYLFLGWSLAVGSHSPALGCL